MTAHCPVACIVPPHMLKHLLQSRDELIRNAARDTLLTSTTLRAERALIGLLGYTGTIAGEKRRTVYDCHHLRQLENAKLVRGEQGEPVADGAVNAAFDSLGHTYDYYRAVHARNSIDDRGLRLDGYVHYGQSFNNAFWNGRQMVFGDGDGVLFTDFTGSLDVVAHELTHGVTQYTAALEYSGQSGALNESVSDVFGSLVKQWTRRETAATADWLIGAEVFTPRVQGDALRSLRAPGTAYDDPELGKDPQPAHMDDYQHLPDTEDGDNGGVHINSGIPNHAFYLCAIAIGGEAWGAPARVWYAALQAAGATVDFAGFAGLTADAAARLYGESSAERRAVADAWREVGIEIPGSGAARRRRAAALAGAPALARDREIERLEHQIAQLASRIEELRRPPGSGGSNA